MRTSAPPWYVVFLVAVGTVLGGCGATHGPLSVERCSQEEIRFPSYHGPKQKIHVVQLHIPREDVERYQDLEEKRVGYGLSKILVDALFETGRFVFLEERAQILRRLVELWELTEDGILVRGAPTALQAPDFLVYAEIFDFVACSPIEQLGVIHKRLTCLTSVSVQVRVTKTTTGQYIPGSTEPPYGTYCQTVHLPLFGNPDLAFDQSAVGKATFSATRAAVRQVLPRLDEARW